MLSDLDRTHLANNIIGYLKQSVSAPIVARALHCWRNVDPNLGAQVARGVNGG